jgi:prolyl-tRNA editing enzyme YbaK/EbsC (Cys-tRNA(Pro) deacylase)
LAIVTGYRPMQDLPRSAERVKQAAGTLGLAVEIVTVADSTRTAEDAAAACGCAVGQIVKSLVFKAADDSRPILFLVSGSNRVDEKRVGAIVGCPLVRPDADFVRDRTGFAIGGIPPFGHTHPIETFMDEDLLGYGIVWAAAGTPKAVFSADPAALRDATAARVIAVR